MTRITAADVAVKFGVALGRGNKEHNRVGVDKNVDSGLVLLITLLQFLIH